ncbi:MAG: hypothetical protein M2R46_04827 [Verrucomicrobia subdivision 3 bacterium]|nr:hypothetical protein [Limisphaerales bacterium]MCS1417074.1 hypothetical protein [Limisphaerales bacterium]
MDCLTSSQVSLPTSSRALSSSQMAASSKPVKGSTSINFLGLSAVAPGIASRRPRPMAETVPKVGRGLIELESVGAPEMRIRWTSAPSKESRVS